MVVIALGITWVLDGLEVTIVGSIASILQQTQTLALTAGQIGMAASGYLAGAVAGALIFGWISFAVTKNRLSPDFTTVTQLRQLVTDAVSSR
jgi:MFS family permease